VSIILAHIIIEFKYKNRSWRFVTPIAAMALLFIDISGTSKEIQRSYLPAVKLALFHVLLSFLVMPHSEFPSGRRRLSDNGNGIKEGDTIYYRECDNRHLYYCTRWHGMIL